MNDINEQIKKLGIELDKPNLPAANYIPYSIVDNIVFVSGQLPFKKGIIPKTGIVGDDVSFEDGVAMAELCALALISQVREACNNNLNLVEKVVKLGGFVASSKNFTRQPEIINGASDLMVKVFGDKGKHSRFAIGVSSLPRNAPVEIEGVFQIKN